ncbi:MAG: winged helix DNA-binding domain-containing protein [Chloroflexota bacterium]
MIDIASRRLVAHHLTGEPFASPVDAVRWLGAVQSQDYRGAKWALAQRSRPTTEVEVDRLFDQGAILRTHVLRPTWHFVVPEDIGWLLELTGSRVRRGVAGRHHQLEIDAKVIERSETALATALAGGVNLSRSELSQVLATAGVATEGRLAHLLMAAELDGVITSGPRRGKEFTYALLEERAPGQCRLERNAALLELTLRFFRSHGPAQMQDFVWWSGLSAADGRTGIAAAGAALDHQVMEGKDYWFDAEAGFPPRVDVAAHLLPNFDEYTVAYRDRAALHTDGPFDPSLFSFGSILSNVVTVGGLVRGSWRRTTASDRLRLEIRLLDHLELAERDAVEAAGQKLGSFLRKPVQLAWQ